MPLRTTGTMLRSQPSHMVLQLLQRVLLSSTTSHRLSGRPQPPSAVLLPTVILESFQETMVGLLSVIMDLLVCLHDASPLEIRLAN